MDINKLKQAYFILSAADGYRAVFTYSEVFNRDYQAEYQLIHAPDNKDGGA